jgi:murein DD-endopeptidase MepM/ murein hydrolase activator NlpD
MWDFLRRILTDKKGVVTLLSLEDNDPAKAETFVIKKASVIWTIIIVLVFSLGIVSLVYFFTPLSTIHQQQMDASFRSEIIGISERVAALQDSLRARDLQLNDLKNFVRNVPDTTFSVQSGTRSVIRYPGQDMSASAIEIPSYEMLSRYKIMQNSSELADLGFSPEVPINGRLTQGYSADRRHFGVDISADQGTPFSAIEEGVVLYTEWTINFGYVIVVQHSGGFVSVYKHGASLAKQQGDVVLKGSILGSVGDSGVLSSGSHLHLEIWQMGMPNDPLFFIDL